LSTEVEPVIVSREGGVCTITVNRPTARNAVNMAVTRALSEAMLALDADDTLSVGILTGAGGNFSSGMDLKAFGEGERPFLPGRGFGGFAADPPRKPLIAAVEGYALAGGFEMALACDLIVAARSARFGLPEARRGLAATAGGLMRLPRRVPQALAMELALTGRFMDAEEARAAGLLNRLVDDGSALAAARELALQIAANAPLSLQISKRVVRQSWAWSEEQMFALQAPLVEAMATSEDAKEGARAFVEKRAPVWKGR